MKDSIILGVKSGLFILSPTTFLISELLAKQTNNSKETVPQSIEQLEENANKQEISDRVSESQAKVLQELAIARRIETADEVEIEEYFDATGDSNVGLKTNEQGLNLGVAGSGRKVVKRVYRFKGWNQEIVEEIEKELQKFEDSE